MARVELAPEILDDFDRIFDHLAQHGSADMPARISEIVAGLDILERHPLIGRPAGGGKRELVLGKGGRGHVALYRYLAPADRVFILAIRSQREAGHARTA